MSGTGPWAGPGDRPLPSEHLPPAPDPFLELANLFGSDSQLALRWGPKFWGLTGNMRIEGPVDRTVATLARDLSKAGLLSIRWLLQSAEGRRVLAFQVVRPPGFIAVGMEWEVVDAQNGRVLGRCTGRRRAYSLERPGELPVTTTGPSITWAGFPVLRGGLTVATASYPKRFLPGTMETVGLDLEFPPVGTDPATRGAAVALVLYVCSQRGMPKPSVPF